MDLLKATKKHQQLKTRSEISFFSKIVKNFKGEAGSDNTFRMSVQNTSNDKYLKLYKIKSNLVDYNSDTLENSIDFTHEKDDLFFGFKCQYFRNFKRGL